MSENLSFAVLKEMLKQTPTPQKEIKSIPDYQREDAAWARNKTYQLISTGKLETVRIMGRQYIRMDSHRRLIESGTK